MLYLHIVLLIFFLNASNLILGENISPASTSNHRQIKLRHQDIWAETNDSIVLNCSLRVNRDQHVVWHRKYDKMGVHVLTIESETFISDLRIRPIKQIFETVSPLNNSIPQYTANDIQYYESQNNYKLTWNLEIRKLKKEDSAFYYCVLNSENAYGQIYKLNVLPHLTMLNKTEISMDSINNSERKEEPMRLVCQYETISKSPNEQIRWYFNKYRIRSAADRKARLTDLNNSSKLASSDFEITEQRFNDLNLTMSSLLIRNFNAKSHHLIGKYKCQVKGLAKSTRLYSRAYSRFNDSLFLLQQQQQHHHQEYHDENFLDQPPPYASSASFLSSQSPVSFIVSSIPQFFALAFILFFNCALIFLFKQIINLQNSL